MHSQNGKKVLKGYDRNAEYKDAKIFQKKIWKIGIKVFIFAAAFRGVRESRKIYWKKGIKNNFFVWKSGIFYIFAIPKRGDRKKG